MAAHGTRRLERLDPATGQAGTALIPATAGEVTAAVRAAGDAAPGWRSQEPVARAAALRAAAAAVRAVADELGHDLTRATGCLTGTARASAVAAADLLEEAATTGLGATGRTLAGALGSLDVVRREPRGVVAVITPWNDPFPAAAGLLAAALVTGNTVVHKPSERSAQPSWHLARLIAQALPDGVLNVVNGDGVTGEELVAHERVALVAHVGSTRAGRRIATLVGARGGRAVLENGGNDPLIVDTGVDPGWAAEQIALGAFANAGQLCTSVERVYLHDDVADAVLAALVTRAEQLRVGPPDDPASELGPMVDEQQLAVVEQHVSDALAGGAECLTGGRRLARPGCYFPATVLNRCAEEMEVLREETFGPVAPVIRVPDFTEGLRRANTGRYRLAATVLTSSAAHALRAAEELDVGTVKVNAVFGGAPGGSADPRRASGSGRGFGPDLLEEMTVVKAIHLEGI